MKLNTCVFTSPQAKGSSVTVQTAKGQKEPYLQEFTKIRQVEPIFIDWWEVYH